MYEITEADDPGEIIDQEALVFVLYEDKDHEDSENVMKAFKSVADEFPEYEGEPI